TPLDELLGRAHDALGATEPRVEIVDDHDVDTAFERALVRAYVGLERRRGVQRSVGTLDRNVDERKGIDRLRLPVFQHLEVFLLQFANDLTLAIGDDDVDFDVIDGHFEGGLRRLWCRRRRLPGGKHCARREHNQRRFFYMSIHTANTPRPSHEDRARRLLQRCETGPTIIVPAILEGMSPTQAATAPAFDIAAVQAALAADGVDAWLLYDFRGLNPIATAVAHINDQGGHLATRRWFY